MIGLLCFALAVLASPFKSKLRLEAENTVLRHQLIVLRRKLRGRVHLANSDRWFFVQFYRWFPSILQVLTIIRPETLIHWHRSGFRCYCGWKSRSLGGRPQIEAGLRALIRQISMENPLWGAPSNLWRGRHTSIAHYGHSGQAYRTSFTLAEWFCGAIDRIDSARMCGPHHCLGRDASAPNSEILC
jgi:hypothetical protein